MSENKSITESLNSDEEEPLGAVGSPSDTFEATVDVLEVSEKSKLLGELVCFTVNEGDEQILVLGQVTAIKTENRWHQEPSFKGIIKRHGSLPNLSGVADNRIAKISVQSSFEIQTGDSNKHKAHKLANSPSTGVPVKRVNNEIMQQLMSQYDGLVCLGTAYDTNVDVPFWFKHFGSPEKGGGGDAYHIGVFGRTGSGKTTTAANIILGYARHSQYMNILILDPQEQFYEDNDVLPNDVKFEDKIKKTGMNYYKYKVPSEVVLPNSAALFSELLLKYGFIRKAFNIHSDDKRKLMAESIQEYIAGKMNNPKFKIGEDAEQLLKSMLSRFAEEERYVNNVYAKGQWRSNLQNRITEISSDSTDVNREFQRTWGKICKLFSEDEGKETLESIVANVISNNLDQNDNNQGNVIVLNISGRGSQEGMDDLQALYVKIIEDAIKRKGAKLYANGKKANCMVVLDEAHRFISKQNYEEGIKELTTSIIDAVRTTRKYGIGYMFITQTIESLHEEIRRQIRIFAFGYGLTSGSEFSKIKEIINDEAGTRFYRSFIDPSSNKKYPFMFYGPISPLSFTGAPLFLEMKGELSDFSSDSATKSGDIDKQNTTEGEVS